MVGHLKKTDRVMIACVTDEVVMVTYPLDYYHIDRVHILNYIKGSSSDTGAKYYRMKFYKEFIDAVKEEIVDKYECVFHESEPTFVFQSMLKTVYSIISEEVQKGSDIYVNLSSGTKEFCAAASMVSMMFDGVKIFTLGGDPTGLTGDKYTEMLKYKKHDGKLVGSYYKFNEPYEVERFKIDTPPLKLVKALKVFSLIPVARRTNTNVIRNLILQDIWAPVENAETVDAKVKNTSFMYEKFTGHEISKSRDNNYLKYQRKEAVQYYRNYIEKWVALDWIYNDPDVMGKKYELTRKGKMNIELYCQKEVFDIDEDDIVYSI